MDDLLEKIACCVERGKINQASPFPPDMAGQEGCEELTRKAIEQGLEADRILNEGLLVGMRKIGVKFRDNCVFVPDVLMAAKAMRTAMALLRPHFEDGRVNYKGTMVLGTVSGDLHDIGKNLVAMMIEGSGWKVIDIGVDADTEKFIQAIKQNQDCVVGLSALLTTTMMNMEKTVRAIKEQYPKIKVLVGGAPLNKEFADKIGADCYCPSPQHGVEFLNASQSGVSI